MTVKEIHLQDLKKKSPAELLAFAEELEVENASSLRKQDMMFSILKQLADDEVPIVGDGVLEVLQDGLISPIAGSELSTGSGRYLCQSKPGKTLWVPDRGYCRRRNPRTEGRRAILCPSKSEQDQFR